MEHISSYGEVQFQGMATRWSTNPINCDTFAKPGVPQSRWESLETGSLGAQRALYQVNKRFRASFPGWGLPEGKGAVPRTHSWPLASPSTLAHPWVLETLEPGRCILQGFLEDSKKVLLGSSLPEAQFLTLSQETAENSERILMHLQPGIAT